MEFTTIFTAFQTTSSSLLKLETASQYSKRVEEAKEKFLNTLNEQQIKDFDEILLLLDCHYQDIYEEYCNKACNWYESRI